jgi:putative transposase
MNYKVSSKGRMFVSGRPLSAQEIEVLRHWYIFHQGDIDQIAKETKLDRRTVLKYHPSVTETPKLGRPQNKTINRNDFIDLEVCKIASIHPELFQREIALIINNRFHTSLHQQDISLILKRYRISNKRGNNVSKYRQTLRVQNERLQFRHWIRSINPYDLVFLDESHFKGRDFSRKYGNSEVNTETNIQNDDFDAQRYSLIAAISFHRVIHYLILPVGTNEGVNEVTFRKFLRELYVLLPPSSLLVQDNASIHKTFNNVSFMECMGINYKFMSPYSPDYNPIEQMFNWVKMKVKEMCFMSIGNDVKIQIAIQLVNTSDLCKTFYIGTAKN